MTPRDKALLLIREVRAALRRGTRHFDKDGKPLTTEREILKALERDGKISFEPRRN